MTANAPRSDLDDLVSRNLELAVRYEQMFLSDLFVRPVAAHDAAVDAGLNDEHFALPEHGWLFRALGMLNEQQCFEGRPKVQAWMVERLSESSGYPWITKTDPPCIRLTLFSHIAEHGVGCGELARGIVHFADQRRHARRLLQEARERLTTLPNDLAPKTTLAAIARRPFLKRRSVVDSTV